MVLTRSATQRGLGKSWPSSPVPGSISFVVDRAYAPGRGRRLRFTKEWIAYVDDLTVRSGRVIDGRFYTDNEADQAIRDACSKGSVATPQSAGAALEALSVSASKALLASARSMTRPKPIPIILRGSLFPGLGLASLLGTRGGPSTPGRGSVAARHPWRALAARGVWRA